MSNPTSTRSTIQSLGLTMITLLGIFMGIVLIHPGPNESADTDSNAVPRLMIRRDSPVESPLNYVGEFNIDAEALYGEVPASRPTPTPTPEPTPVPVRVSTREAAPLPEAQVQAAEPPTQSCAPGPRGCDPDFIAAWEACKVHPDRFALPQYVAQFGWPYDEAMRVFGHESGGDLCAVNRYSGAICWVQQITGQAMFFDPWTCINQGWAKWAPTQSFWDHWYRWW